MTKITNFTNVPNRGQSQEDLVNTTNAFFSEVASFVTSANAMRDEMQNIAENSLYSNPVWGAKAYPADYSVNYNGNCYISTTATLATDVPSVSSKWKQTNVTSSGADIQVFTTSSTWTKPQGAKMVRIILVGGGGGGGGGGKCGTTPNIVALGSGGGGGGGVCDVTLPASKLSDTQSVVIGAGGTGGTGYVAGGSVAYGYKGTQGTNGGNTSFSSFSAYGGQGGKSSSVASSPSCVCADGGDSFVAEQVNYLLINPINSSLEMCATYKGAHVESVGEEYYKKLFSMFGGCSSHCSEAYSSTYAYYNKDGASSVYAGAAGGSGYGVYQSSSNKRVVANSNINAVATQKFLPSRFGSYTSVGGTGGTLASLTANGTNGTNATGYGAGGGGGASCTENYTSGSGGNGSPGIAIIISW